MPDPTTPNANLFALLIGIDCYLPNRLPDNAFYPSLGGCVRDVAHIEEFLRARLGLSDDRLFKLTATNQGTDTPPESPERLPTYDNIVAAFKAVTKAAKDAGGGQIYVHYSGHGGRTPTAFAEVKGTSGLDESLVPCDIGKPGTRYVRDLELGYLLKRMVDEGLTVTVVLDSCHSGGATRGMLNSAVRGISSIDTTARPTDSLVASHEDLIATWSALSNSNTRSVLTGNLWLPDSERYVLLAACRANELANEFAFDGRERNGALTYWLLDALRQLDAGLTYKNLHDRLLAKVHAKFPQQTPQLLGDATRNVFGSEHVQAQPAVRVLQAEAANNGGRVLLNAGQAQNVAQGARFAIYPAAVADFSDLAKRTAIAEVQQVQPTQSWAQIVNRFGATPIDAGDHAIATANPTRVRARIRTTRRDELNALAINQDEALSRVAEAIGALKDEGWIRLATADEPADYQVAVNFNSEYEVWDATGRPIKNLRPAIKLLAADAPAKLVERLTHLTKYQNIRLLDNSDPNSVLMRKLVVEWRQKTDDDGGAENVPLPFPSGLTPLFDVGESAYLYVRNDSEKSLNVAVIDLQPDWGISKIFPVDADAVPLEPHEERYLPATASLPKGYDEGTDTLKVFATVEPTSFDWLQLPELDKPQVRGGNGNGAAAPRAATNSLEALFAALSADKPRTRQVVMSAPSRADWAIKTLEMKMRRPLDAIKHVRDPRLALLQSAFDETIAEERHEAAARGGTRDTAKLERPTPNADDSRVMKEVTDACLNIARREALPAALVNVRVGRAEDAESRGAWDTISYCGKNAVGVVTSIWDRITGGGGADMQAHADALREDFGDCDPKYLKAVYKYAELVVKRGKIPYRHRKNLNDNVFDDAARLPADATIGFVADWGTGRPEAIEVLRQVRQQNPQIVIHLGDVYYAGTAYEVENYFLKPWREILAPDTSGIASYTLAGNHDYYSGGQPFYDLLDELKQPASFFCLRNDHWQIIGLDTSLHDKLAPHSPPTSLEPSELEWLLDKMQNKGDRRTVLLSHHQLFSTNEQFEGQSFNPRLYDQLAHILPQVDLWLWGHEHDLVLFEPYKNLQRGRCIGGSAFPVGKYELSDTHVNPSVPYKKDVELSKGTSFYQHCYAVMKLDREHATISYYEDSDGGRILFSEVI